MGHGDYQKKYMHYPRIRKPVIFPSRILAGGLLLFCLICCLFLHFPSISIASADARIEGKKNVLILNSYHQGYKWTDDETQGAIAGLDPARNDIKVVIEYMGTKWAFDEPYFEQLRSTYKHKFRKIRFDMIIATDDDAFNFLKRNRDELFPNTPVVFCGVNWFKPESVPAGFKGYTGVNEDADIPATLDLMLNLHPGTKKVYVVNDMTTTGKKIHAEFDGIIPKYKGKVSFTFLEDMDMSEILDTVGKLGNDSLVLMTLFQKDKAGTFFEFDESTSLISKSSRVPVYGLWDFDLGFGIVGGMLTSGYSQGKTAGEMAVRIMKREKAEAIPVLMKSPNRFMFDYTQMQRWNISRSNLPADSVVTNEPLSFYAVNKGLVWVLISVIVGIGILIVVLFINTVRRKNVILSTQQETSMDGILVVDESDAIISFNQRFADMWEIPPDLVKTKAFAPVLELVAGRAADPEGYMERVKYLYEHKEEKCQKEIILKDGRVFDRYSAPMRGDDGKYFGRVSYFRDITERKRAEEKLFQVTERWERTFDAVPDLIAIIDNDFRIVQVNKAMADRLGATSAECAGQVCYAAVHKSESPPSFCPHAQTLTDGHEHMCEVREECLGGDFIVSTSPIYDSAGQLMGSVHVARDITERKHAETKLNEQLHFLQQLLDSIPIPVYYKDVGGVYLGCNAAFERFIGLSRSDIVGKTVYEVAPKERADKHHEADSALLRHPGLQIYEAIGIYNDGEYHNVIFNKATFVDANNCVAGTVGAMIDITSLRKAEEERKMLESQLHQSQKMEAIGQLAGGIAHDFNNILTAIMGYAEMVLLKMERGNPFRRHLEQISASSKRAAELTNDLLTFSRRQVLHAKPMDLGGVVRGLEKMLGRLVPEDIDFRTTVAEGDLIVMADKGQIEQVLMNLVTNAKDAMPRGGNLTIEVSPVVMEERFVHVDGFGEPGDYACVTVSDTGQGMDEETRERIFEPFFTTKEVGKGTGLGMAIIYGIIQQHNGYISVYSEKERGTKFKIYLPLIAEGIKEVHDTREAEPPPGGTETVLLAEDDATVLELHKMILEEAGYKVIEAVDGQDALDKFTEHRTEVDILATDVIMPKINGKSLYEEISKIRPDMKVLFISGYTKDIIVERGIMEDEFSVITKPVTSHELLKKMRELLDRNRL